MWQPILIITSYYFSPVITTDITSHSNLLQCPLVKSICAGDLQSSEVVTHSYTSCYSFTYPTRMKTRVSESRELNLGPPIVLSVINLLH